MTVLEVLQAAREAALEIRRIEEQTELKRLAIGVQGHGYDFHSKTSILDPTRRIDELLEWEAKSKLPSTDAIDEGYEIIDGASHFAVDGLAIELATRYYLQAESYVSIARDLADVRKVKSLQKLDRKSQIKVITTVLDAAIREWEQIGIAHLKEAR